MSDRRIAYSRIKRVLNGGNAMLPGNTYRVDLRDLPTEVGGVPLAVSNIYVEGSLSVTNGSGGAVAVYGQPLRALANIKLSTPGHEFLRNIDGERLAIDASLVGGTAAYPFQGTQSMANGAGADNYAVRSVFACSRPTADDDRRHDDSIPVSLLTHEGSSLSFDLVEGLGVPTSYMKVTNAKLTVYFDLVTRDDVVEPSPWHVGVHQDPNMIAVLPDMGAFDYVLVNARDVTATTFAAVLNHATGLGNLNLEVNGQQIYQGFSYDETVSLSYLRRPRRYFDYIPDAGFGSAWSGVPVLLHPGDTRVTKRTRGGLALRLDGTRPSTWGNFTPLLYRVSGKRGIAVSAQWLQAMRMGPSAYVPDAVAGGGEPAGRILPARVIAQRQQGRAFAAGRAAKRLARGR